MKELNPQEVFEKLGAPFTENELEWRATQVFEGKNGNPPYALVVPYLQSRAIMNRFDDVLGWDRWENLIQELPGGGIVQGIRIWISETRSITKWDGPDRTNIESTKGGISSAFKRAANLFNCGRYLYALDSFWVNITQNKVTQDDVYVSDKKKNIYGYFTPPSLGQNNNQGRQQTHSNQDSQNNQLPPGMFQCQFGGILEKNSQAGPYLEVWFLNGDETACLFAIGEMRDYILSLNLQEGDNVAVASDQDQKGNFILKDLFKVA